MTQNEKLLEQIKLAGEKIENVKKEVHKKIVGQEDLIDSILIWLFWKGHILIEWVPGLAKTMTVDTISKVVDLKFNRVQFTPDLLPSDLIWTEIYNPKTWEFSIKYGPIFTNIVLADEINRAPSKVQSALLEAMAEKQITIGNETFKLEEPFIVLATQNPVEQAGTYKLPEAQLDRFMMKVDVDYADKEIEKDIYKKLNTDFYKVKINQILTKQDVLDIQILLEEIYVSDNIYDYVSSIIDATRNFKKYDLDNLDKYVQYWISPRWWINLIQWAKVVALTNGRNFVIPEDVKQIAGKVLAHRLVLSYEAVADSISAKDIINEILKNIEIA